MRIRCLDITCITAQQMKSGTGSSAIFDSYGGLGALSKGSVSLISYVFQFRTNADVSATRVSALATAKCQARAFGDVSCEQLPASFTNRIGGCDDNDDAPDSAATVQAYDQSSQPMHLQSFSDSTSDTNSRDTAADLQARDQEAKAVEEERRRDLESRMRDC